MKVAISIWNDSISNVFDFSSRLLLVETEDDQEISRSQVLLKSQLLSQRVNQLKNLEADILVCGAISRKAAEMITVSGIQLLPYITGSTDDILQAYQAGQLAQSQFAMPGCWPGARKGFGRCGQGRRRCRRQGNHGNIEL